MPGGRPTDLTDKIVAKAQEYLYSYTTNIPTIAGLAIHLGCSRSSVYKWSDDKDKSTDHEQFSYIVDDVLATQELNLIDNGLSGSYNATITKLLLAKHGYHEKVENENNTKVTMTHDLSDKALEQIVANSD